MGYGLYVLIGAVIGGGLVWLVYDIKAKRIIDSLQKRVGIAEAENLRIPTLEGQIAEGKARNGGLAERNASLQADVGQKAQTITELNAQLAEQAKAAKNKLSMLNDVQGRFCQALAALSETALNCDNDEFVRLMEVNVTTFERTLLEDIGNWQLRDQAVTREVCEMADREQGDMPLFVQDEAMEELVAASQASDSQIDTGESAAALAVQGGELEETPAANDEKTLDAEPETPVCSEPDLRFAGDAQDATREREIANTAEDEPAAATENGDEITLEGREEVEEVEGCKAGEENQDVEAALIDGRTEDAVAALEKELEEELALELQDAPDDSEVKLDFGEEHVPEETGTPGVNADEPGEIHLAEDGEEAPSLKFPAPEEGPAAVDGADDAAADGEGKKKLNFEPGPLGARREAV